MLPINTYTPARRTEARLRGCRVPWRRLWLWAAGEKSYFLHPPRASPRHETRVLASQPMTLGDTVSE